jgi:arylsulfatase A-like enzyme
MKKKPNLLFIFTDQQRFDTLACYGNHWVKAPHLNQLAEKSFVFENAYVTQPVCTPSRSTILTGQYPHTNGCVANNIHLKPETKTIAEMVSDEYTCAYYGKWHLGDEIFPQHGFSKWLGVEDSYRRWYSDPEKRSCLSDYHKYLVDQGFEPNGMNCDTPCFSRPFATKQGEKHTKARYTGRESARFISENKDNPFILFINFLEPHTPYSGPFEDLYDPETVEVSPSFNKKSEKCSMAEKVLSKKYGPKDDEDSETFYRKTRATYHGNVTLVDNAVGDILKSLEENGLTDNTIIVFTSDHGDMVGNHSLMYKTVMYEEAVKVPMLIRVPWISNDMKKISGRISQIDLLPTLLELMNEPIPNELEGVSRKNILDGNQNLDENDVVIEWNRKDARGGFDSEYTEEENKKICSQGRTIISADSWKLNLRDHDIDELFDLNSDPHEMKNLIDEPDCQQKIKELSNKIKEWQQKYHDTLEIRSVR